MFRISTIKKFIVKNKIFFIITFLIFLISLLFPYSGDDWYWGSKNLSIASIVSMAKDIELNGRYLGNIFVILLTENIFIRGIIISLTLSGIIHFISKSFNVDYIYIVTLLLLMSRELIGQAIIWASGFANYTVSTLFLLISLLLISKCYNNSTFNIKQALFNSFFIFLSCLFVENLTIFFSMFLFITNFIYLIKNKKVNYNLLICLIGAIIGLITMFTHPAYLNVIRGNDSFRQIYTEGNIFDKIFETLTDVFSLIINNSVAIFVLIIVSYISYIYKKNKKSKLIIINLIVQILSYIISFVSLFNNYSNVYIISATIFIFCTILMLYLLFGKKSNRALLTCCVIILLIAPLLIVKPVGPRNLLMIYVLEIVLLVEIINLTEFPINKNILRKIFIILGTELLLFYIAICAHVLFISIQRDQYVMSQVKNGESKIVVPYLPYYNIIWNINYYRQYDQKWYKKFNGIPNDIEFEFIDYDIWNEKYYDK